MHALDRYVSSLASVVIFNASLRQQHTVLDSVTQYWSLNWDLQLIRIQTDIAWLCPVYQSSPQPLFTMTTIFFTKSTSRHQEKRHTKKLSSHSAWIFTVLPQTASFLLRHTWAVFQNKPQVQFSRATRIFWMSVLHQFSTNISSPLSKCRFSASSDFWSFFLPKLSRPDKQPSFEGQKCNSSYWLQLRVFQQQMTICEIRTVPSHWYC